MMKIPLASFLLLFCFHANAQAVFDFTIDSTQKPLFRFHYKPVPETNYRWGFYHSEDITKKRSKFITSRIYASGRNSDTLVSGDYRDSLGVYWVCLESMDPNGLRDTVCKRILNSYRIGSSPLNIFSPNNSDSITFNIHIENESYYHLSIFNRWGVMVFESWESNNDWNGRANNTGVNCPDGNYYYILEYRYKDKKYKSKKEMEPVLNGVLRLFRE